MSEILPLLVVMPIFTAALIILLNLKFEKIHWQVTFFVCILELILAFLLNFQVFINGRQTHELGGYDIPYGIQLVGDGLSAPIVLLIALVSISVIIYTRYIGPDGAAFYSGSLLLIGGLAGVTVTGDVFNMYVFLEITGLAAYALVASDSSGLAAIASLKYLILGTIGASFFLLGVAYLYIATGTLNMVDLSYRLAEVGYSSRLVLTAFGLIVTGLAVKIALFPLHTWQPDAYQNSPYSVTTLISALVSTVAAYALGRIIYSVFTVEFFSSFKIIGDLVVYAGIISIIAGSILAVMQSKIKRMLAYSSVSHFGMIVAGFGLLNQISLTGGIIHLIGHSIIKGGLFATGGIIAKKTGSETVDEYSGMAKNMPVSSAAFAVLAVSLIGIPPTIGFVGKWYIAVGAVQAKTWIVASVILISTLLTLSYFAKVIEKMYFGKVDTTEKENAQNSEDKKTEISKVVIMIVVSVALVSVFMGFLGSEIENILKPTIESLFQL